MASSASIFLHPRRWSDSSRGNTTGMLNGGSVTLILRLVPSVGPIVAFCLLLLPHSTIAQPADAEREFRRGLTALHEFEYRGRERSVQASPGARLQLRPGVLGRGADLPPVALAPRERRRRTTGTRQIGPHARGASPEVPNP